MTVGLELAMNHPDARRWFLSPYAIVLSGSVARNKQAATAGLVPSVRHARAAVRGADLKKFSKSHDACAKDIVD